MDAIKKMKCGPEALWDACREKQKMTARDAFYHVLETYNRDALFKGYTYPHVSDMMLRACYDNVFLQNMLTCFSPMGST